MKLFTGWVMSAGLVLSATAASAQMPAPYDIERSPYTAVSDVTGPYAAMPPEAPPPRYYEPGEPGYQPGYGGPMLMPPSEVYAVVRDNGFSPIGIPRQRGMFYTISVIDGRGDDGRLVIDARTRRIIRFMPAYRMGDNFGDEPTVIYGRPPGPLAPMPPVGSLREPPRPPAPVPRVASRTPAVPLPKAPPPHAVEAKPELKPEVKPLAAKPAPEPAQQSAAVQAPPTDVPVRPPPAVPIVEAKPTPPIQPTQPMPKAQGLE
ncbi:MAG: hypothetical protein E7813_07930 [Bradyrhizobium sp.]|uniref:SPOR domain-containing protein n=1 Tax=Bradyrhizobium sp. TaxID=376 RepID=UPI001229DC4D|nr:hypothetical protein [Bradyrhizobium sp.]THD70575.1 MAG: hypothetical protein E7813_07930 [Bradyrhizobium sp.]